MTAREIVRADEARVAGVANIAGLRAITSAYQAGKVQVFGATSPGDGQGGLYRWNAASSATDNGTTVVRPDSSPATGRWELVPHASQHAAGQKDALTPAAISALGLSGGTLTGALTLPADPTTGFQAATKQYVDAARSGLDVKQSVKAAATANITLSGAQTVDGIALVAGDRCLVKNQTTASQNGIYDVASGAWARSSDADTDPEVTAGLFVFVEQGTTNHDTGWVLSTDNPITVGTTALTFAQFSSAASAAGVGSIAGVSPNSPGGNVALTAGTNVTITPNDAADTVTIASSAGAAAGTVVAVDTMVTLRAISVTGLSTGEMRQLNGYYASADGGGGLFRYNSASSATDNGGTVIAPNAGSGRWERVTNGWVDVKWFGAKGDGTTNDTSAVNAALFWGSVSNDKMIYLSPGTYLITQAASASLVIRAGTMLVGAGYQSVLKFNPASLASSSSYNVIFYQSNTILKNFRVDGSKGSVSGVTNTNVFAFEAYTSGISNVVAEDLWIHDIFGHTKESFGFAFSASNVTNVKLRRIEAYNIGGAGISIDGDYANNLFGANVEVDECKCYSNDTQGITLYGAKNVKVRDCVTYSNTGHGINMEWSTDVDIYNCKSYSNGNAGIGSWGYVDYRAFECTLSSNNSAVSGNGEVRASGSTWATGSPTSSANVIELRNCSIAPNAGGTHVYWQETAGVTMNSSVPASILVDCDGAHTWTYATSIGSGNLAAGLNVTSRQAINPLRTKKISEWTTAGATPTAYTGSDRTSADAVTISATGQFQNIFSPLSLKAGRRYLVTVRAKINDTKRWQFGPARDVSFGEDLDRLNINFPKAAIDAGQWFTTSFVADAATNDHRLMFMLADVPTVSSSITIDYVSALELPPSLPIIHRTDQQGEATIDWRTALPSTGTWTVPSIIYNSAPSQLSPLGWVAQSSGTAGTYSEGRTASTTSSSPNVTLSGTTTVLQPGDYLTINAQAKRVVSISGTAMVMDSNFSSTVSGQAIAYTAPTFGVLGVVGRQIAALGSDVAVSGNNVFADVTGLSFAVVSGTTYRFRAAIHYDAAATSTGSRWAVNGPATPTRLAYTVTAPTPGAANAAGAQVQQQNQYNTYDASVVGAFSPFTTGNLAMIDGIITPSANGTVIVRLANEVNGSAITAKAGSTLEWW